MKFITNLITNQHPSIKVPEIVTVDLPNDIWINRLKDCTQAMISTDADSMVFYGAAKNIQFYNLNGEQVEFGNELDACTVRVFIDNAFQLYMPYEHQPYDTWTNLIHWGNGLENINKDSLINWINNPANKI